MNAFGLLPSAESALRSVHTDAGVTRQAMFAQKIPKCVQLKSKFDIHKIRRSRHWQPCTNLSGSKPTRTASRSRRTYDPEYAVVVVSHSPQCLFASRGLWKPSSHLARISIRSPPAAAPNFQNQTAPKHPAPRSTLRPSPSPNLCSRAEEANSLLSEPELNSATVALQVKMRRHEQRHSPNTPYAQ